jgi:hypothetical protein
VSNILRRLAILCALVALWSGWSDFQARALGSAVLCACTIEAATRMETRFTS